MLLGIDVGGTHTDAVIIGEGGVAASYKAVTDHSDLLGSMTLAIREVVKQSSADKITSINLSTTLSTNAIIEDKVEQVGVFVSSGPGIDPANFKIGSYYILDGSIDHRGEVRGQLDAKSLERHIKSCAADGIKVYAAVTKFSTRNPIQENAIKSALANQSDYTTTGHLLSGTLSFPRRVTTAYYNSAVWRIYNNFADAMEKTISNLGIKSRVNILKADGGTMPISVSRNFPVESILSGPAASVMGIIALCDITEDSIIIDIGGTTSDIAVFAGGSPLIEKSGIKINHHPTMVRALKTRSFGIGGDSAIKADKGIITAGPERRGPSMAEGGSHPTLVDAMNFLGIIKYSSVDKSTSGINALSSKAGIDAGRLAQSAVDWALEKIKSEIDAMLEEINSRPVYTIREMIHGREIKPKKIYLMGGPAAGFASPLKKKLSLETAVPENYAVANAIGAALARTTIDIELFADTGRGVMLVPNLNIAEKIGSGYNIGNAESDARKYLEEYIKRIGGDSAGHEIETVESSSFRMINGYYSAGSDIRVKCQVRPGAVLNLRGKGGRP